MSSNDYYLDSMGIKRWHFRDEADGAQHSDTERGPSLSHYVYQLFQNGKLKAYLITEATLKNAEEADLVEKIVQATKLDYQGGLLHEVPQVGPADKVIHLMHSPAEMLKNPSLKREVWERLKSFLQL